MMMDTALLYDLFKDLAGKTGTAGFNINDYAPPVPTEVKTFLGELSLLRDVPHHYLVPEERLLPRYQKADGSSTDPALQDEMEECGSIRFFWLDPLWVQCLLNGALSMSEPEDMELLLTKAMEGNYAAAVLKADLLSRFKTQLYGNYKPEQMEAEYLKRLASKGMHLEKLTDDPVPTNAQSNWRYTGFLFRSALVSGWKGLEVEAKGINSLDPGERDNTPRTLGIVRMETIAPDTYFCMCEGIITEVVITQPPENLHFAIDGEYDTKDFYITPGGHDSDRVTINFRETGSFNGVININDGDSSLASQLKKVLAAYSAGNMPEVLKKDVADSSITSVDMALATLAKPVKDSITLDWTAFSGKQEAWPPPPQEGDTLT
jgi:hypothetical protein